MAARVRPDSEGRYYEDFLVGDGQYILLRRITQKVKLQQEAKGWVVERHETNGDGRLASTEDAWKAAQGDQYQTWRTAKLAELAERSNGKRKK